MKKIMSFICLSFLMILVPVRAYTWGAVTHAYFAKELGKKYWELNFHEVVYGATLPDMFNLKFGSDYKDSLWYQTHYEFMKVVSKANGSRQKAFAFGFVSHNNDWGVDYTAHLDGRTTPGIGYVIKKIDDLKPELIPTVKDILVGAGISEAMAQPLAEVFTPGLAENFIETAVDLLIKRNEDPEIGTAMLLSAQFDDFEIDSLLVEAYSRDFAEQFDLSITEASEIISGAEQEFRELIKLYGNIFVKEESEAIELLGVQGASYAEAYISDKTDSDVTVPSGIDSVFAEFLRDNAIPCVEGDYGAEVSATLAYLEEKFEEEGLIIYLNVEAETPVEYFLLNAPNPFNPTTTITYGMGKASHVTIEVYNVTGQKMVTLFDGHRNAGSHTINWNASGFANGVYFAVMRAEDFMKTKKIMLVK